MEISKVKEVTSSLEKAGYQMYSRMLSAYTGDGNTDKKRVAVVGDGLVGKSTFINWVLGKDILPTGALPNETVFNLSFGDIDQIRNENNEIVDASILKKKRLNNSMLNIDVATSEFEKGLVISELPNFISKKVAEDFTAMSEIYECDAVVLVMTAERLLSEAEQLFISNYTDFIDEQRLLIVINKMNMLPEHEVNRVIEYFESHKKIKFSNVRCVLLGDIDREGFYSKREDVVAAFREWCETEKPTQGIIDNALAVVKSGLENKKKEYSEELIINEEDVKTKREQMLERRTLEESTIEKSKIEFLRRKNKAVEIFSDIQGKKFSEVERLIQQEFLKSDNPEIWYRDELQNYWKKNSKEMCVEIDRAVSEILECDIEWLNNVLNTEILMGSVNIDMQECKIDKINPIVNYNTAKKIVPFGIAGGVAIGFYLFKIIGAVACAGVESLLYSTIVYKSNMQREAIVKNLHDEIMEISRKVRKVSENKIIGIYDEVLERFVTEAKEIIDDKYTVVMYEDDELKLKIKELDNLIFMMEG